jgi:hypothetical protein
VKSRKSPVLAFILIVLIAPALRAATLDHLQSLISQLASDSPQLRASALNDLMGLNRKDLPLLREAALSQCPLLPAQISGLRQVVPQVYLAGEKFNYDPTDPRGFLGVQFLLIEPSKSFQGVLILDRIRGFPAFRYLQPGDVVVSFLDFPQLHMRNSMDFISAAQLVHPGQLLRLGIVRHGQTLSVAIPMDFRPLALSDDKLKPDLDTWILERDKRAQAYWDQEFSIIEPSTNPEPIQASTSYEP